MKIKFGVLAGILLIILCACSVEENEQKISESKEVSANINVENSELSEREMTTDAVVEADLDIQTMLENAETKYADLEQRLYEDAFLTQADMNDISYKMYVIWDELLNEVWVILKQSLDKETMEELLDEQHVWITEKEVEVKRVGEEAGGGSIAGMLCNQRATKLTRIRVYELLNYLGFDGISSQDNSFLERIEETPYQEVKTTISFIVEGIEEEVSAIMYEGENYSITIPEEDWKMVSKETWRLETNNEVQISIIDYTGEEVDSVRKSLSDSGYNEMDSYFMSFKDKNGLVWNVRLFANDEKVIGIFYDYPIEAAEGFGVRLSAIVDTFEWN